MSRSRASLVLLFALCALVVVGCTPRRGGGGGGGGGGGDDISRDASTGAGKNVGDTEFQSEHSVEGGSASLWIVNYSEQAIQGVFGWACDDREASFQTEARIDTNRHGVVSGLEPGCWEVMLWNESDFILIEGLSGDYTWVVGEPDVGDDDDMGDDDDADDDDDDPRDNVWVDNYTEYTFYELVALAPEEEQVVVLCEPFSSTCTGTVPDGQWFVVAFMDPGRLDNDENCWIAADSFLEVSGNGEYHELVIDGDLQCGL